ncbi:unnamed protein product [Arabidopsis halleri]
MTQHITKNQIGEINSVTNLSKGIVILIHRKKPKTRN